MRMGGRTSGHISLINCLAWCVLWKAQHSCLPCCWECNLCGIFYVRELWNIVLCFSNCFVFVMGRWLLWYPRNLEWTALCLNYAFLGCRWLTADALCLLFYMVTLDISVTWCQVNEAAFSNRLVVTLMKPLLVMSYLYQQFMFCILCCPKLPSVAACWQSIT